MKISIVVLAYDKVRLSARYARKICAALANVDCDSEIIVINNASTDKTAQIAKDFG